MRTHDSVSFAREVLRQLAKALKMRRLYGRSHAHATQSLSALGGLVRSFIKLHDALALEVRKEGFFLGEDPVAEDGGREGTIGFALYVGGVRVISFRDGIADQELERLIGILAAPPDMELAALIAQEDLPHVYTVCLDELAEGWDIPENMSEKSQRTIDVLNKRAEALISEVETRRLFGAGDATFELSETAAELEGVAKIGGQGTFDANSSDVGFVGVPDEALDELRTAVRSASAEDVTRALVEIVLDGIVLAPDELPRARAGWFLDAAPRTALARGDLGLLASILERFEKELAARTSRELAAPRQRIVTTLEPIVEALGAPEAIARLVDAVAGEGPTGTPAAFVRCASFMGRNGVTAAVSAYLKATTEELRSALNQFLVANAERNPGELTRLCAATVSVETAKWALFTASKHLRGPLAESLFAQGLQHPEAAVRDYANFLWRTHTPAGRIRAFLDTLDVPDVGERVRAAEAIGRSKDFTALDPLKKLVDDPKFLDRTAEEKRAILGAIAAIGGTDSAGFLMRQSERPTGLFRRRAGAEVRDAAAKLLEGLKRQPPAGPSAGGAP